VQTTIARAELQPIPTACLRKLFMFNTTLTDSFRIDLSSHDRDAGFHRDRNLLKAGSSPLPANLIPEPLRL
jgi:hypothetical protein